jgi:hypothetical protein
MTEMEHIVKLLRDRGGFTSEEQADLNATIAGMRRQAEPVVRERPQFVFNDRGATIIFPDGFSVTFDKDGTMNWAYDGKKITDSPPKRTLNQQDLQQCLQHIVGLHIKDKAEMWSALLQWKNKANETRTRYVKNNSKRAFVAGLIMGQQEK